MRHRVQLAATAAILGLSVAAYWGIQQLRRQPPQREVEAPPLLVEVVEVAPRPLTLNVVTQGTVQPRTQTVLTPEVSGRIVAVSPHFVAGGFFREGEVLLEIDPSDYEAAVARAEAEVARQSVLLTQEQARSDQARRDWEAMGRGDPNELTLRVPQMNEARANLRSAEAALATARRNLERTRVRAPYDGLVREKRADVGQYVGSNAELGSIFATDYAEIRLPLADEDLAYLELPVVFGAQEAQAGPPVVLEGRYAGRPHTWPARIVRTEGTVDPASRLVYAVARVEDPYNRQTPGHGVPLPVGLFVRASIQGISLPDAIVLPRQTLRERNQLFVVTPGNTINVREVDVLRADSRDIVLTGGVAAGERVALSALEFVTEGMQVEPLLQENPVPAAVASTAKPSEVAGE